MFSGSKGLKMLLEELFNEEVRIPSLPEVFYQFKKAVDDPNSAFSLFKGGLCVSRLCEER
jgi:hypothetical protein